jgi:hypothetical protein
VIAVWVLIVTAAAVGTFLVFFRSSGPTSAERSTCAVLQDVVDDLMATAHIGQVQTDLRRAVAAANRSGNDTLSKRAAAAGVAMDTYATKHTFTSKAFRPVVREVNAAAEECEDIGFKFRSG